MEYTHNFNSDNGVNLYERKYLGNGRYFQRGTAKDVKQGDSFSSFTCKTTLVFDSILSLKDSKGKFRAKELGTNSLYEAELIDEDFVAGAPYQPINSI